MNKEKKKQKKKGFDPRITPFELSPVSKPDSDDYLVDPEKVKNRL
jgi:hypothetical protein